MTDAAGRAVATAGRSVVFAASTVLVSLMGLRLSGLQVYASFGFATALAVVAVMAASLTLVPALCRSRRSQAAAPQGAARLHRAGVRRARPAATARPSR